MGSIYITYTGACPDRAVQDELVGFMAELAERSRQRIVAPQPPRPKFLELMTEQRDQSASSELEPIRRFDGELVGELILDPYLAPDGQSLYNEVEAAGVEKVLIEAGQAEKQELFVMSLDPKPAHWALRLKDVSARGLDFQLYDPRQLYPTADRLSFVFLDCPQLPSLTGCLAQIESRQQCQAYQSPVISGADLYVSSPSIHLRYCHEEWMDGLLAWVKFFFIPELDYARYEALSGYKELGEIFTGQEQSLGREAAKRAAFDNLLDWFEAEADQWSAKIAEM